VTANSHQAPTIKDVARLAGVSHMTVSRVVSGSGPVRSATRARVDRAAAELGYAPNVLARGLASRRTGVVGFLASDISNPYIAELARAIHRYADEVGYVVNMLVTDYDRGREQRALDMLVRRRVDGMLVGPPATEVDDRIRAIAERGLPVVAVARRLDHRRIPEVTPRVTESSYAATVHLLDLGHRRIGYIAGSPRVGVGRAKIDGYRAAMAERGIAFDPELLVHSDMTVRDAYSTAGLLLRRRPRPSAVMGATDTIAIGAMGAIEAAGLRIPDDVSVVGFDDTPFAETMHPPLTTVAQPTYELGRVGARVLFDAIAGGVPDPTPRIALDCALLIRGSTGPCRDTIPLFTDAAAG
jgi:LacI family transcriptional regulator